ncbi:MAG TPA: 3,4-dihydroxy-2-butanone-4-phosphate synthase [Bryobacteraceae bacterium]|jgi:3,4-dihydroxy 2-butanone 4-phosphate synthase/GTP cyclohydrolase II
MAFASIPEAIEEIRAGRMLIVVDDEDRENEGDLTMAAQFITPEAINFMAVHGRGLICLALAPERCDSLHLPLISPMNTSRFGTAFCESIDAAEGVTTGISAADRARTVHTAIRPGCRPRDLARPGHVFPLRAREGGVLVRAGQTEAAVDLARLAKLEPGGVICEIMNDDGTMARVPQLVQFCEKHRMKMISVASLIRYRRRTERFLERRGEGCLRTEFGDFKTIAFVSTIDGEQHIALVRGEIAGRQDVLVRMHARCVAGDVFGSTECDCHATLLKSLERIADEGCGVLVYLHETGMGERKHSPSADRQPIHESGIGAQILAELGLTTIRLLTNHPRKVFGLDAFGIEITGSAPLEAPSSAKQVAQQE